MSASQSPTLSSSTTTTTHGGGNAAPNNNNNSSLTSSFSSSGLFRQRNGSGLLSSSSSSSSGFFDRLRRPRTATSPRETTALSRSITAGQLPTDYSNATDVTNTESASSRTATPRSTTNNRQQASNGLPRSQSSSHVHLQNSSSNNNNRNDSRRPGFVSHQSSHSQGSVVRPNVKHSNSTQSPTTASTSSLGFPALARTDSSQGSAVPSTSGSNFTRMVRRSIQGATGRLLSNAHSNDSGALDSAVPSSGHVSNPDQPSRVPATTSSVNRSSNSSNSGGAGAAATPSEDNEMLPVESAPQAARHRIRLVPHLEATRSLHFEPIERDLFEGAMAVKIGRFTDRTLQPTTGEGPPRILFAGEDVPSAPPSASALSTNTPSAAAPQVAGARGGAIPSSTGGLARVDLGRIAFKSKVVSRGHAELWSEAGGKVFVRDTKSSSGTFLNHIRLSAPNMESRPFQVKDGDVVQLGVDYQGGTEEIYRCVKMRVELNRDWQRGANQFNVNALRQLRALQGTPMVDPADVAKEKARTEAGLPTNRQSLNVTDCCICLFSVTVCQALFIAPCSHVFHYKCIRPLLNLHHPGFSCPLCRTFADLEAEVEEDEAWQSALMREANAGEMALDRAHADASTPMNEEPVPSLVGIVNHNISSSSDADHFVDTIPSAAFQQGSRSHDSPMSGSGTGSRRGSATSAGGHLVSPPHSARSSHHRVSPLREVQTGRRTSEAPGSNGRRASQQHDEEVGDSVDEESAEELLYEDIATASSYLRRPSGPIDISSPGGGGGGSGARIRSGSGISSSDPTSLSEARTPQNEHFLSTLAETPSIAAAVAASRNGTVL